jgi:poly(ADP-ribose) glycohydrolase
MSINERKNNECIEKKAKRTIDDYWARYHKTREPYVASFRIGDTSQPNESLEQRSKKFKSNNQEKGNYSLATKKNNDIPVQQLPKIVVPLLNNISNPFSKVGNNDKNYDPLNNYRNANDQWDSIHVKMPYSSMNKYQVHKSQKSKWYLIEAILSTSIPSAFALQNAIVEIKRYDMDVSRLDLTLLIDFFQSYLTTEECSHFFNETLPWIQKIALKLPELFTEPIKLLRKHQEGMVKLSSVQIASLMAHAFFCTFPGRDKTTRPDHQYATFPYINFTELYKGHASTNAEKVAVAKLKTIINYFEQVRKDNSVHIVEFHRRVLTLKESQNWQGIDLLNMWENSEQRLINCTVELKGAIEDVLNTSQVDFANKSIGGGVIGRGCVQEEIRFLINTECIIARLFTEEFDHNECMIIRGAKRYANCTGYRHSFQFVSPYDGPMSQNEEIVCMDALNFKDERTFSSTNIQYEPKWILRELNKAFCAFQSDEYNNDMLITTGHWGGGVFGGDRQLKAIIQLIAASQCKRKGVNYMAYEDEEFAKSFSNMFSLFQNIDASVGEIFRSLMDYNARRMEITHAQINSGTDPPIPSVLEHILKWLTTAAAAN